MIEIRVAADQYEDFDNCLQAAELDYVRKHGLEHWEAHGARWADANRDEIALLVPGDQSTVDAIVAAKAAAGGDAYLWLHTSGDCILWDTEEASEDDDGANAVARWTLTPAEATSLLATGEVSEQA